MLILLIKKTNCEQNCMSAGLHVLFITTLQDEHAVINVPVGGKRHSPVC